MVQSLKHIPDAVPFLGPHLEPEAVHATDVLFIRNRFSETSYHAHTRCFFQNAEQSSYRIEKAFTKCGPISCHFCDKTC